MQRGTCCLCLAVWGCPGLAKGTINSLISHTLSTLSPSAPGPSITSGGALFGEHQQCCPQNCQARQGALGCSAAPLPHVETLEGGDRGRLGLSIQPGLSLMRPGKQNNQLGVPAVCVCVHVCVCMRVPGKGSALSWPEWVGPSGASVFVLRERGGGQCIPKATPLSEAAVRPRGRTQPDDGWSGGSWKGSDRCSECSVRPPAEGLGGTRRGGGSREP